MRLAREENPEYYQKAVARLDLACDQRFNSFLTHEQIKEQAQKILRMGDPNDLLNTLPKDLHRFMPALPQYPLYRYRMICSCLETMWKFMFELSFKHDGAGLRICTDLYSEQQLEFRRRFWDPNLRDAVDEIISYGACDARVHLKRALARLRVAEEDNARLKGRVLAGVARLQAGCVDGADLCAQIEDLGRSRDYWIRRAQQAESQIASDEAMAIKPLVAFAERKKKVHLAKCMYAIVAYEYAVLINEQSAFPAISTELEFFRRRYPEDFEQAQYYIEHGRGDSKARLAEANKTIERLEEDRRRIVEIVRSDGSVGSVQVDIMRLVEALGRNKDLEDINTALNQQLEYAKWKSAQVLARMAVIDSRIRKELPAELASTVLAKIDTNKPGSYPEADMSVEEFVLKFGEHFVGTPAEDFLIRCRAMDRLDMLDALDMEIHKAEDEFAVLCEAPVEFETGEQILVHEQRVKDAIAVLDWKDNLYRIKWMYKNNKHPDWFSVVVPVDVAAYHMAHREYRREFERVKLVCDEYKTRLAVAEKEAKLAKHAISRMMAAEERASALQRRVQELEARPSAPQESVPAPDLARRAAMAHDTGVRLRELERAHAELEAQHAKLQEDRRAENKAHIKLNGVLKMRLSDYERAMGVSTQLPEDPPSVQGLITELAAVGTENRKLRELVGVYKHMHVAHAQFYASEGSVENR
jgi:hypothetical protein